MVLLDSPSWESFSAKIGSVDECNASASRGWAVAGEASKVRGLFSKVARVDVAVSVSLTIEPLAPLAEFNARALPSGLHGKTGYRVKLRITYCSRPY